jgi:hypothetical protein
MKKTFPAAIIASALPALGKRNIAIGNRKDQ